MIDTPDTRQGHEPVQIEYRRATFAAPCYVPGCERRALAISDTTSMRHGLCEPCSIERCGPFRVPVPRSITDPEERRRWRAEHQQARGPNPGRKARHLAKLGLTQEDFDAQMERQGGVCPICRETPTTWALDLAGPERRLRGIVCRRDSGRISQYKTKGARLGSVAWADVRDYFRQNATPAERDEPEATHALPWLITPQPRRLAGRDDREALLAAQDETCAVCGSKGEELRADYAGTELRGMVCPRDYGRLRYFADHKYTTNPTYDQVRAYVEAWRNLI